jgi:hypothetical protein
MKFHLSISPDYCRDWGVWEVAREVISNALDSEAEGHAVTIEHRGDVLLVSNKGVKLDPSIWLLGTTSKTSRGNQRGQFGEGLKIAMLAAVRMGLTVEIVNDDEAWTPTLEESDVFKGTRVLTVTTRQRSPTGAFVVAIAGVQQLVWEDIKQRFLALKPPADVIATTHGSILVGEGHKGKIYVKGVFVQHNDTLSFGYDFTQGRVDRDRKMMNVDDARISMAQCWIWAALRVPRLIENVIVPMLEKGAKDIETMALSIPDALGSQIRDLFVKKYGDEAMAVRTPADALQVGHYGKRGVVLPGPYVNVLEKYMGTLGHHVATFAKAVDHVVSMADLDDEELTNLVGAIELVDEAGSVIGLKPTRGRTDVVVFKGKTNGMHLPDGTIQLARKILRDPPELRRVLVHELAHDVALDGDKRHEAMEGTIHTAIQEVLLARISCLNVYKGEQYV